MIAGLVRGDHIATMRNRTTVTDAGCWNYGGYVNPQTGYGQVGKHETAHRISYTSFVGPIADGLVIDHLCRNRTCWNPEHLEAVTPRENTMRGPGAKTHCIHGHEYTPDNTAIQNTGRRTCRACRDLRNQRRRAGAA